MLMDKEQVGRDEGKVVNSKHVLMLTLPNVDPSSPIRPAARTIKTAQSKPSTCHHQGVTFISAHFFAPTICHLYHSHFPSGV